MNDLRDQCRKFVNKHARMIGLASVESVGILTLDLEAFAREVEAQALERAANIALKKIRCDDRTDRLRVANEVAAHIIALKEPV